MQDGQRAGWTNRLGEFLVRVELELRLVGVPTFAQELEIRDSASVPLRPRGDVAGDPDWRGYGAPGLRALSRRALDKDLRSAWSDPGGESCARSSDSSAIGEGGYPRFVALEAMRGRMPLLAVILFAVLCLALIGFACACLDDQFAQAFDRIVQSPPVAVIELWPAFALSALASFSLIVFAMPASDRASPASLQRFLF
jgi:hypothetical protein